MIGDPYQVSITYCNGQVFRHDHADVVAAVDDYSSRIAEGLEPETDPGEFHVRLVVLVKYGDEREIKQHIDSGPMNEDCAHQTATV